LIAKIKKNRVNFIIEVLYFYQYEARLKEKEEREKEKDAIIEEKNKRIKELEDIIISSK
jgi:hypothetical protein